MGVENTVFKYRANIIMNSCVFDGLFWTWGQGNRGGF